MFFKLYIAYGRIDMTDKRSKSAPGIVGNNFYILKLAFKACPRRVIFDFIIKIINYAYGAYISVFFMRFVFNALQKQYSFGSVTAFVLISLALFFAADFAQNWYNNILRPLTDRILYKNMNLLIFEKASDVELACFENPEFYNKYTKAAGEAGNRAIGVLDNISGITGAALACLYVLYVMFSMDRYAVLFTIIPVITTFTLGNKLNKQRYEFNMANVPPNRRKDYVKRTVYLQCFAKEIRLSNIFNVLAESFNSGVDEVLKNTKKYGLRLTLLRVIIDNMNEVLVFMGAICYATIKMIIYHNLLIGDYIVFVNAIATLSWNFVNITKSIISMQEQSLYIQNLREFIDYSPKILENQEGLTPKEKGSILSLKNVTFKYESAEKPSLCNISFDIRPNEKIALVGKNGAGKSTLVKLLMRLYDVTDGEILLNGENIKNYNVKEYRSIFGTVFQDFQVFSESVADNVSMGTENVGRREIEEALRQSDVYDKIKSLKNGMDTTLTKEFDDEGAVLSGGEYQKIALARVFVKSWVRSGKFQIAVFDEPSSALDPIAEHKMYESMMTACKDKAVVFISHRLSSAVTADMIYMLEDGRIIESGTHKQLMDQNGRYADMFRKQAEKYTDIYHSGAVKCGGMPV